jgi:hypothetical protein
MMILHSSPAAELLKYGRLVVTLTSKETGQHITLRLKAKNRALKKRNILLEQAVILGCNATLNRQKTGDMVGYVMLVGRDAGQVRPNRNADPARLWAFEQLWKYLRTGELHPKLDLKLEKECAHCGIALADPVSIARGVGPDCYGKLTGSTHQRRATPPPASDEQLQIA